MIFIILFSRSLIHSCISSNLLLILAVAAKSLQSCPTLCNPLDGSPPGSPLPGILQARTLEWAAISLSDVWKWKVKPKLLSRVQLYATPWTEAYQAPLSMGFSRQEYWSGVPLPSPWFLLVCIYSFISVIVFFTSSWLFFLFSNSLLNFTQCPSILLLSLWSIFMIITLSSLLDKIAHLHFA